jgi:hypothetical protein
VPIARKSFFVKRASPGARFTRQPRGYFLQRPAIAVRIPERRVRGVTQSLRIEAVHDAPPVGVMKYATRVVKGFIDRDAASDQFVSRN